MNLKRLSASKSSLFFILAVAGIGFLDAVYLTIEHYMNAIPPCTFSGCEIVLTSPYAEIAGIPVALLGALYYLAILVLGIAHLDTKENIFISWTYILAILGFIATIYFFLLQAFVINSFCQYCLISTATSTLIFLVAIIKFKTIQQQPQHEPL